MSGREAGREEALKYGLPVRVKAALDPPKVREVMDSRRGWEGLRPQAVWDRGCL